jgi:polyphenol oxidase
MPGSDLNQIVGAHAGSVGHQHSPLLAQAGFRHAFFTRQGGASEGPFESLSFSTAVGDSPTHVNENLRRAATLLGVDALQVLYLSQVHGRQARFYDRPVPCTKTITLEGDAIGGCDPSSAYGVRTADCVPILLADSASGAVMAIHAGWRGVVAGVVEAGVASLLEQGASPPHLLAAIGPHISLAAFEVSEEVASELTAVCPAPGSKTYPGPASSGDAASKPHIDLRFIVTKKLTALGLNEARIDQVGGCTFLNRGDYFSFRRDGKESGRHLSAIVPRR